MKPTNTGLEVDPTPTKRLEEKITTLFITWLNLDKTAVTDKGIQALQAMPQFSFVTIQLTNASFQGGIIRGAFFPRIASDRVTITLNMPNGTNEKVTDSIISFIENKSIEVISASLKGKDLTLPYNKAFYKWALGR